MIKYVMDHGKEIQIVPPNPELADKINRIGKRLLRMKKINRYSNDAAAICHISTTNRAFLSTWPVEDMRLSQSLRAAVRSDVGIKRLCHTWCISVYLILHI